MFPHGEMAMGKYTLNIKVLSLTRENDLVGHFPVIATHPVYCFCYIHNMSSTAKLNVFWEQQMIFKNELRRRVEGI